MTTVRLTTAEAIVRWLVAQRAEIDGTEQPFFPGVFAIFGHGNVTCLGHALAEAGDALPTWRGQNEQGMALAATAFAKATRRRQVMVATSSIGPGALNMVTAAGVAMANRLPLLLLAGDTFASRVPDPVLQQIEQPGVPGTTANDAFRPVVRYWDRITRPEQLLSSLPQALRLLTDPAECGPAFLALPQDVQAEAFDFPGDFFRNRVHTPSRPRPDTGELGRAAAAIENSRRPMIIAGGGVHYSLAEGALAAFADGRGIPVAETMAGKTCLTAEHPMWAGPIGVTGWDATNQLAAEADLVLAVGTRLTDFTTGSWTVFSSDTVTLVAINAARFDAVKHGSIPLVGDALVALEELDGLLGEWQAPGDWTARAGELKRQGLDLVARATSPDTIDTLPTYAQVVGAVNAAAGPGDYVVTAAGGLPGEVNLHWLAKGTMTFDCEYGFSTMGYEIAGGWGAAMARPSPGAGSGGVSGAGSGTGEEGREAVGGAVFVLVGDGSYLMANSDLYSSVLSGHPMIVIVCDNGGFAVIERLQRAQGGVSFTNMLETSRAVTSARVDFAAHAEALGCHAAKVGTVPELTEALLKARVATTTSVIVVETEADAWTDSGAFWEVGVPEVSPRDSVRRARRKMVQGKEAQWLRG